MKKFFIRFSILLAVLWLIFFFLDMAFEKKALEDTCRRSNWTFSFENEHFDFIISGSSRAYNMADITVMEEESGKKGLNVSFSGTGFEEQYLILRKFLNNGNTIDQLFLQSDISSFNSKGMFNYAFHDFNYLAYLDTDTMIANVVKDNSHQFKFFLWKNIPFVKYMEFNIEYPVSFLFKDFSNCNSQFDDYGYKAMKGSSPSFMRASEDYDADKLRLSKAGMEGLINEKTLKYFNRIVEMCEKEEIELVMYTPPIFHSIVGDDKNRSDYKEIMSEIADEYKVQYVSFLSDSICFSKSNFFDAAHTNKEGTVLFSKQLAKSIN